MRSIKEAFVGDTIFKQFNEVEAMPGFKAPKPMVIKLLIVNKKKKTKLVILMNFKFLI